MNQFINDLFHVDIQQVESGFKLLYCDILPNLEKIEDELAKRKNPLLIVPTHLSGMLLSKSGNFNRNPYAYRPYLNQYFLYHRFIETQEIMFGDNRINRIIIIEQDNNNKLIKNDFFIFQIYFS